MLVYNLTGGVITYKGRKIPANGGFVNIPTLSFIPTRDLELETARVLSFGKLPKWWLTERALKTVVAVEAPKVVEHKKPILLETPVTVEDKPSVTTFSKKK